MKASHTTDGLNDTIIFYKIRIEMLQNLNWNIAVDGFPLLPTNPSLSKPSFNVIVLQPKTHFNI